MERRKNLRVKDQRERNQRKSCCDHGGGGIGAVGRRGEKDPVILIVPLPCSAFIKSSPYPLEKTQTSQHGPAQHLRLMSTSTLPGITAPYEFSCSHLSPLAHAVPSISKDACLFFPPMQGPLFTLYGLVQMPCFHKPFLKCPSHSGNQYLLTI